MPPVLTSKRANLYLCTAQAYASPSLFFLSSSNRPFTPSRSPIAALPLCQSTTMGHLSALGFCDASLTTPSALVGRVSTVGCAESKTSGEGVWDEPLGPVGDLDGRYDRIVRSWSAVGGVFSMTSRSNFRGGADGFEGGYGPETADRSRFSAFFEAGEEGLWLEEIHLSPPLVEV